MIVSVTQNNFDHYLQMNEGYMVNKTFKTDSPHTPFACAHDLAHPKCSLAYSASYPKFYTSTFQEAQAEAQQRWNLPCEECPNCR